MSIKIIEEPELVLTRAQYDAYLREYRQVVLSMVNPPSFEEWVRAQEKERKA